MKKKKTTLLFVVILLILSLLTACMDDEWDDYDDDYGDEDTEYLTEPNEEPESDTPASTDDDFSAAFSEFIEETMQKDGLPGAAVAVVRGDEIIFAEGFGYRDVDAALPVTIETLFHIGSTNKSMTAMLTAILVDEGYFDWDTPVIEIYPDFELENAEATETVTMRHLLSMQSGIPDTAEDDLYADRAEDVFDHAATTELLGAPGDEFSYSNISASLAGYLDVIAAGYDSPDLYSGYEKLLTEKVLAPCGMDTAVLRVSDAEQNPNYGKSYYQDGSEADSEDFDGDPLAPSGAVKASIMDMAAYISAQLNEGVATDGTRVVSAENLSETWKPSLENYGMGWETGEHKGTTIISHEGSFDNYLSVIGLIPDLDVGFVVLTNSEEAGEGLIIDTPQYLVETLGE